MGKISHLEPKAVFEYFEEITKIPHGSGNMEKISEFCMKFAEKHQLPAVRDKANNVIIRKAASKGYENAEPVILQGHLDMVCQKDDKCDICFSTQGIDIYEDGEFIHANGTTLGADNGIAVAMILSILADNKISHPPIEAVFTTDEEIGMIGASALDMTLLTSKRMINLDSEDFKVVTVSCAGGSDFKAEFPLVKSKKEGYAIVFSIKGLAGGHSGVEINSGRVNANILMGRILSYLKKKHKFQIAEINGGDKVNAISVGCRTVLISENPDELIYEIKKYADMLKEEIKYREPDFYVETELLEKNIYDVIDEEISEKIIYALLFTPNGVLEMSAEIDNLVETSLNLGILKTEPDLVTIAYALRSNKKTALEFLEEKLCRFFEKLDCKITTGGHYPPWEYKEESELRRLYIEKYKEKTGNEPRVEAIHAGLECGVFAAAILDFDCISIGPEMHGIHTTSEKLSIRGTKDIYEILLDVLKSIKN